MGDAPDIAPDGEVVPRTEGTQRRFGEHQLVRTTRALREQGAEIPAGALGVVVDIYDQGDAYEVEFREQPGLVLTLDRDALVAADDQPRAAWR